MAASDQVLVSAPQVSAAPLDYVVPNAQEIALQTVQATFDGSGASGQWLPVLQVIGPGGIVAGTFCNPGSVLASGVSAEVTFGTFLGAVLTPSPSSVLPATSVSRSKTSQVISPATTTFLSFDTVLFDDLGWFNPAHPTLITVSLSGQYLVSYVMAWIYPATGGFPIQTQIGQDGLTVLPVSAETGAIAKSPNTQSGTAVVDCAASTTFGVTVYQFSGGNMSTWIAGGGGSDVQAIPTLTVIRVGDRG